MSEVSPLVRIAAAIDDRPSLGQVDEMLGELAQMERTAVSRGIEDALLEMRGLMTG